MKHKYGQCEPHLNVLVTRNMLATLGAGIVFGFGFAYMLLSVAKFGSVQDNYIG